MLAFAEETRDDGDTRRAEFAVAVAQVHATLHLAEEMAHVTSALYDRERF